MAIKFNKPSFSLSDFKYPFPEKNTINRNFMEEFIRQNWFLNRTAVNPDTDQFVSTIVEIVRSARIVEAAAGSEQLGWLIPLRWQVRRGLLMRKNGDVIVDFADNPLYLWTHSVSFSGEIERELLLNNHICTDPSRPDEFIYHFRNGYRAGVREWGFSLPYTIVKSMTDPTYLVEIETSLDSEGTLKVVDVFIKGELNETIFIMAHTCHPAIVSDGIGNIAVALELYSWLVSLPTHRYSWRFLFGPEYFGAAAWLNQATITEIKNLHNGLYLDMMTTHEPLGFQRSFQGNALIDKIVRNVLESHLSITFERPYRQLWGNDETFYNGPDFYKPVVGIGRAMHREYHYNTDNMENLDSYHMVESSWILRRIAEVYETDYIPVKQFRGPLHLSRYGVYMDPNVYPDQARNIESIQILMDGKRSCMDIADYLSIDFFEVMRFCDELFARNLVTKLPRPVSTRDSGQISALNQKHDNNNFQGH